MPFVERNGAGAIVGVYTWAQDGYAEEFLPDDDPAVVAYIQSSQPKLTVILKADIWRRATDDEAVTIDTQLKAAPIRLQRMWADSQTLTTTDPLYPMIEQGFVAAFGNDRAAELLQPTA
ncbi:hypothetical protein GCM10007874_11540 [Labrys miyagiensis]|uniref:Uncharacterized protein n=1 Tax=Labrys miyagiensis TaxID=346912 RepID=A0ABQ6CCP5_9HYPH|nr:hypothetical protein [Labrys miyagiensis]GLS18138.1 hypothetical protein GCM10007874_11540 [Labrys miyagiensis]